MIFRISLAAGFMFEGVDRYDTYSISSVISNITFNNRNCGCESFYTQVGCHIRIQYTPFSTIRMTNGNSSKL